MNRTITMGDNSIKEYIKNYYLNLSIEKAIVEKYFEWLKFEIKGKLLCGKGVLIIGSKKYKIELFYSPFFYRKTMRFDKIYIKDKRLVYNDDIHVYRDLSLCLHHPIIDKPLISHIPLYKIIPRISEWCIHYEEYLKYGVWLGKEIKH